MADDVLCAGCDRPVPDALPLCPLCGARLVDELLAVPGLLADLTITRAGLGRLATQHTGTRPTGSPMLVQSVARDAPEDAPQDPVGAELRGDRALERLQGTLGTWARVLADWLRVDIPIGAPALAQMVANGRRAVPRHDGMAGGHRSAADRTDSVVVRWTVRDPATGTGRPRARLGHRHADALTEPASALEQAAVWMACHPHELRAHEAAGDMLADITGATTAVRRVVDLPPDLRYLGPCPGILRDGSTCAAELLAERTVDWVRCRRCRTQHDVRTLERAAASAADEYLYTLGEVLRILAAVGEPVPRTTLYRWRREGKIEPRGWLHADRYGVRITDHPRGERDQPVFRLGDVRALARRGDDEGGSAA
ncbi:MULTISPECIES: hypothetical protein [unclassified Nocardia]|uniref:hypothetical protein n=1 Tax=unclassified Nocardia TaxID=2637762 RepID=UPI00278BB297|nr:MULTISPECIES: hypothetical protein [unclassified Nocardia]